MSGIIENSETITATGAIKFESGGYYKHTANGGSMVRATWDANSTCEISGITSATALTNLGSGQTTAYGNLIWNCTGQTAWFNATGSFDVAGNFTVNSTGGGARGINLVTSSVNRTFNIGGNLEINGAKLTLTNSSGIATLNIGGNLVLNNSSLNQLDFGFSTSAPSSGNYRSVINLSGDFYNGVFRNAAWMQPEKGTLKSNFHNGIFYNSEWINGTFLNGTFQGKTWWDGNFTGGDFVGQPAGTDPNDPDYSNTITNWWNGSFNQGNPNIKSRFGSYPITGNTMELSGTSVIWHNGTFIN